ncbi:MAG TPA: hypothetical protein DDZ78_11350 [Porphyromonadaceae bacterium]|nr:hypothetical protein [Porphyromonadaceae bacterium]
MMTYMTIITEIDIVIPMCILVQDGDGASTLTIPGIIHGTIRGIMAVGIHLGPIAGGTAPGIMEGTLHGIRRGITVVGTIHGIMADTVTVGDTIKGGMTVITPACLLIGRPEVRALIVPLLLGVPHPYPGDISVRRALLPGRL